MDEEQVAQNILLYVLHAASTDDIQYKKMIDGFLRMAVKNGLSREDRDKVHIVLDDVCELDAPEVYEAIMVLLAYVTPFEITKMYPYMMTIREH